MRNGWVRWAGWGLACLAVVGLVGCQGREEPTTPSPTRSASVSLSPSASPSGSVDEQALIDEAVAVVEQYYVLGSAVENNGGEGWEVLIPLLTPEAADAARAHFETLRENGWHTEGDSLVSSVENASLESGLEAITITYCVDATGVVALDSTDTPVTEPVPTPFPADADLTRVGDSWLIANLATHREQTC